MPENITDFLEVGNLSVINVIELAVGLLILGILVIQIIGAEKSVSRLFLQADVNLLFASPLSPQMVLLFRLATTVGLAFATFVFLLFEVPSFMRRFHLSLYAALCIPIAWFLLLAFSVLIKALIYEIGSRYTFFRDNMRWFVIGALGVLGALFYVSYKKSGEDALILSAYRFFRGKYYIPVWGWIKGFLILGIEGNVSRSLAFLLLCLLLIFVLLYLILRFPADYYEDTMARTEEIALLIEDFKNDGVQSIAAYFSRPQNVRNADGFHYGWGSSVYFYKVLYNRFRMYSSRLRAVFFTRTGITYLIAAAATGWFDRKFLDSPVVYIPVLVLAAMVFFRTLFSPVTEDIRKASFLMQPDPIWSKLFFSIFGGSCNCALDVLLPLMVGVWIAGFSPLRGLLFLPVLVAVDFFASTVGAFVEVSLPQSIGTTFRQVAQILLLYVGLIFDGMILTSGIDGGFVGVSFLIVTVVNLAFGGFFLGMTGVWLYPCSGREPRAYVESPEAKREYSRVGLALAVMYITIHFLQIFLSHMALPSIIALYLPIYLIGFPVFILMMKMGGKNVKKDTFESSSLTWIQFLLLIPVCFFVMYSGSIIGNILAGLLYMIRPFQAISPVEVPLDNPVIQAVLLAIVSPVIEEYAFRRCIIERVITYGQRTAVLASALLFGLFHGTVNQLCYAFMLGLVFGHVYVKTRRLRYTICLHIIINTLSSIVLPALLLRVTQAVSFEQMSNMPVIQIIGEPGVLILLLYLMFLFFASLFGGVAFFFGLREKELPRQGINLKTVYSAWGIIIFTLIACIGIFIGL